jgi:RsiW-degrading membrane proteinase PrsW (M82 family)
VAGILSGAGFALYENLAFTTLGLSIWLEAVLLRIGAAVLHIGTTAFLGWALARAWSRKQYAGLGITYAGAVLFHGLWNALALLSATGELVDFGFTMAVPLESIGLAAMLGLPTLALAMLVALLVANARLRRGNGQTPTGDAPQA